LRLTRRSVLVGGAASAAFAWVGTALAQRPSAVRVPTGIEVEASPIDWFSVNDRDRRRFGALTFRSGLVLRSQVPGFGGFSGLWRSPDGRRIVAMSDNAQWLSARVETSDGLLSGLSDAVLAPILGPDGVPLRRTRYYDTEGFTISGGVAYVSVERHHAILRFDWKGHGVKARGQMLPLPDAARHLPSNSGLEAVGVAPARSPLSGALVAIAEQARDGDDAPTLGFILTGPHAGAFEVARSDNFNVTDLGFLPDGELLLLERRFSLLGGLAARIRRIPAKAVRAGARIDGPVIFQTGGSDQVDNMEGMALHQERGETVVTLISDDNFRTFQRTLLLEFTLAA
jgi:hypothetical protein